MKISKTPARRRMSLAAAAVALGTLAAASPVLAGLFGNHNETLLRDAG